MVKLPLNTGWPLNTGCTKYSLNTVNRSPLLKSARPKGGTKWSKLTEDDLELKELMKTEKLSVSLAEVITCLDGVEVSMAAVSRAPKNRLPEYCDLIDGATLQFLQFFEEAGNDCVNLQTGRPCLQVGDIIVMDNLSSHHYEGGEILGWMAGRNEDGTYLPAKLFT